MPIPTLIIGESGSGKSSSIRHLDPSETFIINVLDKPLPFKGFKGKYIKSSNGASSGNYFSGDSPEHILSIIGSVSDRRHDIKNLILDDFQYVMANEFMRRAKEKGYDKFTDIGSNAHAIVRALTQCRSDLNCIVINHSEVGVDGKARCKTIGKMVDEKVCLEGMFTIVLHAVVVNRQYKFMTQNNGSSIAKSPAGMFDSEYIDNDLDYVVKRSVEYFNNDI